MIVGWILEDRTPKPVEDIIEWGQWIGSHPNRHVADDRLPGNVRVSTVFLGLDHDYGFTGIPLLFETMIFGGEYDGYMERYSTWAEAEQGHKKAIEMIHEV